MFQEKCKIISNEKVATDYYKVTFSSNLISSSAQPGQFVEIRLTDGFMLRRPFSFHKIGNNSFDILYHVVGKGSEMLSQNKNGEEMDILGPLGKGFEIIKNKTAILISGGCGTAPLYSLEEKLKEQNIESHFFMGAKTKDLLLCRNDFTKIGTKLYISTDDGSCGEKCTIGALFSSYLDSFKKEDLVIYSCGPKPMLKAVAEIALQNNIACQISLEERMACGVGACLGCTVETKDGNKRVCKDGPVFNAEEIIWQ